MKLLIATTNPGKFGEFKKFLSDVDVSIVSLRDEKVDGKPEETGATYEENALLKARFYMKKTGLAVIADDGGFEIDALAGEPGIKSHRWLHQDREDEDEEIIQYTMHRLTGVPESKRSARLRVTVVFLTPDGAVHKAEGSIEGIVPLVPASFRHEGFPYRSLLYLPEYGEFYNDNDLPDALNNSLNHRKKAVDKLKPQILKYFNKIGSKN